MNETNDSGLVHQVPAAEKFTVRGQTFELHLLDTIYDLQDMAKEHPERRDYLGIFRDWIKTKTGVELSLGEADDLSDQLELLYAKKKYAVRDAYASIARLPSSTASAPPA